MRYYDALRRLPRLATAAPPTRAALVTRRVQPRTAILAAPPAPPHSPRAPGACPHDARYLRGGGWCTAPARPMRLRAVCTLVVLAVLCTAMTVSAQVVRPFTARFATNVAGDIRLLGNTLLSCPQPGTNGCTGNNNSFSMVHVKDTPDATVLNRSTADLALPAGATVLWAGLYWGGRSGSVNVPANRDQMQFHTPLTPGGTYVTITSEIALDTFTSGSLTAYQGFATVTGLVSAAGSGTYVGADVKSSTGANGYTGWALVVVFTSPTLPTRNLVVFDGFANVTLSETVGTADTVETTLTGFLTPVAGAFTTRVGAVGIIPGWGRLSVCVYHARGGGGLRRRYDQYGGPGPPQQCHRVRCRQSCHELFQ